MSDAKQPTSPRARRKPRHDEWTREKMVLFLRELAATQSISLAAKAVGMSRTSAYNLRNRLQGQPFALGWEVALETGMHQLAHVLMDRAVNGIEEPIYYHGELVATRRRFDNRLGQWILENPWKVGRNQLARELASGNLDALLERIETASLHWEGDEGVPGPGPWPVDDPQELEERDSKFIGEMSWYASEELCRQREPASGRRR